MREYKTCSSRSSTFSALSKGMACCPGGSQLGAWHSWVWAPLLFLGLVGCESTPNEPVRLYETQVSHVMVEPPEPEGLSEEQIALNVESFEYVWKTVRDKHWDPEIGGLDWEGLGDELRPRVAAATSQGEARGVMQDLLSRLEQSHFGIVPSDVYDEVSLKDTDTDADAGHAEETHAEGNREGGDHEGHGTDEEPKKAKKKKRKLGGEGQPGFDLRVLDSEAVVVSVQSGSSADQAGVRPGWVVREVDDRELSRTIERVQGAYDGESIGLVLHQTLLGRLSGEVGDEVEVSFEDGDGEIQELELSLLPPLGQKTEFGNMPVMFTHISSRRLPDDIGYIAFSNFMAPGYLTPQFAEAVTEAMDCKGIVVDVRGNPGGLGILAAGLSGFFIEKPNQKLGTMTTRSGPLKFIVFPRADTFKGRLAILIDECSASTAEIYAQGLKDLGRARVFGTRTAGAALPSQFERLPNGDGFQYAMADYVSSEGVRLEGNGVGPDQEVRLTRASLLAGRDIVLDAATDWILSEED